MKKNNPKLLLVTRNFPPLVGGMEKLNFNISRVLKTYFDVSLSGPAGSKNYHNLENYTEFPSQPLWKFVVVGLIKTIFLSIRVGPAIIFCGSGAAILSGYFSARLTSAKLVCYLHGLDIVVNNSIYQYVFMPLIKKSDLILVNSNHTKQLAVSAGVSEHLITVIAPGTDLPSLNDKARLSNQFRERHNLKQEPILLIVGRITARKGITEFIEQAMPKIIASIPNVKLFIIGDEASDAIQKHESIKQSIVKKISSLSMQGNVKLLGCVDDDNLTSAIFSASLLVFPVLNLPNDVEGFGMVAIEAAAHGLPTIGYSVGGVPDAISENESGWLVPEGDCSRMAETIIHRLQGSDFQCVSAGSCINFASKFEWCEFEKKINHILSQLI